MALAKRNYVSGETVITAKNLNEIQDSIIALEGTAGADGVTPHIGDNGNWYIGSTDTGKPSRGATGATGPQGLKGETGTGGKTPIKGTDYWTAADKQEIVNSVIAALPDGTDSLYARIDEQHDGTKYDPIPYSGNMALEAGKYYSQSGKTYLCNRDTGNPVYNALADLVGLYVIETEV